MRRWRSCCSVIRIALNMSPRAAGSTSEPIETGEPQAFKYEVALLKTPKANEILEFFGIQSFE